MLRFYIQCVCIRITNTHILFGVLLRCCDEHYRAGAYEAHMASYNVNIVYERVKVRECTRARVYKMNIIYKRNKYRR